MQLLKEDDLTARWKMLQKKLSAQFGQEPELEVVLFLIGVQELGKGYKRFSESEKLDLINMATCHLLSRQGYYESDHIDEDGWTHYKLVKNIPKLSSARQEHLLKQLAIEYFAGSGFINQGKS